MIETGDISVTEKIGDLAERYSVEKSVQILRFLGELKELADRYPEDVGEAAIQFVFDLAKKKAGLL